MSGAALTLSDLATEPGASEAQGEHEEVMPIVMREAGLGDPLPPAVHDHAAYLAAVSAEASFFETDAKPVGGEALSEDDGRLSESSRLACDALSAAASARKSYAEWREHASHLEFILKRKSVVRQALRDEPPPPLHPQPWVGQQDGWSTYRYHPAGRASVRRPVSARPSSARKSPCTEICGAAAARQRPASARPKLGGSSRPKSPYSAAMVTDPLERILNDNSVERRAGAAAVRGGGGSRKIIPPPPPRRVRGWREAPVRDAAAAAAAGSWRRNQENQVHKCIVYRNSYMQQTVAPCVTVFRMEGANSHKQCV
jgi:hypothetical protein